MRGGDKGARMASAMAVVAGRAARPCDVCARKRSRWYCAADEAYLCDGCDSSVHAANALAFRHERVRLTPSGAPMKMDRRINSEHAPAAPKQKKPKSKSNSNLVPSGTGTPFPQQLQHQHEKYFTGAHEDHNNALREVKVESMHGHCSTIDHPLDPSDDHFTAEELTGNANVLDDTPSMCPTHAFDDSSSHPHGMLRAADFEDDFLVSDPNDPKNNNTTTTSSASGGDVVDEDDDDDCVGTEWMDLGLDGTRDISSADDDYCIDPVALRESASAHDGPVALYSHDEKPGAMGCVPSSKMGKPFKNIAGQSEWVKLEEGGYPQNYSIEHQQPHQDSATDPLTRTATACKIEGLSMSKCDLRQAPSLRLNYEDVLSSWPDRGMRWTDDGSGSQLVPDGSSSDAMGSCYDLGLVPDLSQCGVDGSGYPAAMYGGCGPGGGLGGSGAAGDESAANAGNAREARVIRYREKRRTRLFSKKIRYEVRKLNAERRPRMKGRFVKRSPGRETETATT